MATLSETTGEADHGLSQIHDALVAGVDVLSGNQEVEFWPYVRTVLPIDGFIFWLRADLLPPDKLALNGLQSAGPITVAGSLHYASIGGMQEDEVIAIRKVDFTAENPVEAFAQIAETVLYIGEWQTPLGSFKFTFSSRNTYYKQADIHHYVGDAVYPVFETQLIDDIGQFDQRPVVSNSIPLWLHLASAPPFTSMLTTDFPLFPGYLIPQNLSPPYGAVNISRTRTLTARPWLGRNSEHLQICAETARVTLYGLRNDAALDFLDYVYDYVTNYATFGITNMPVVMDEQRTQVELAALAQKKVIEFEISYVQASARDIARQLIAQATIVGFYPIDNPILNSVVTTV